MAQYSRVTQPPLSLKYLKEAIGEYEHIVSLCSDSGAKKMRKSIYLFLFQDILIQIPRKIPLQFPTGQTLPGIKISGQSRNLVGTKMVVLAVVSEAETEVEQAERPFQAA